MYNIQQMWCQLSQPYNSMRCVWEDGNETQDPQTSLYILATIVYMLQHIFTLIAYCE